MTLSVRSAGGGVYWWRSSRIDGMAIATRMRTGTSVQTTSIVVLCELRDGVGFALRRKRYIVHSSRPSTKMLMSAHSGSSQSLWNSPASWPIGVTCIWMPLRPSGSPMPGVGIA